MTIEEIFAEWDKDSVINRNELGDASLEISKLHNKYYKIYIAEKYSLMKMESDLKVLKANRFDFWSGSIDDETLEKYNWTEEFRNIGRRKILRTDVPKYLEADSIIIDKSLKVNLQKEKVDLVDSIIKSFVARGFNIKNSIEWAKFQVGA